MKHLTHPLLAMAIQAAIAILLGSWWAGALVASAAYIMREVTQAEYRWIAAYGAGLRANMPWWGPFDLRVWNVKAWTDWLGPVVVTVIVALVMA